MEKVVIIDGKRTAFGKFGGTLIDFTAVELGAMAIRETLKNYVAPEEIDQVIFANVQTGGGISPIRQTVMAAGWPKETNTLSVERACCSSISAAGLAFEKIMHGRDSIIMVGGQESLSNVPYTLPDLRWGKRLGDITLFDPMIIRNPYLNAPMAQYAGEVGVEWGCGREMQDEWGVRSHKRAHQATENGYFKDEIFPVEVKRKKGDPIIFDKDEHVRADTSLEKIAKFKPVYGSPTVTAGNASGINDGASAMLLMSESEAVKRDLKPIGRIVEHVSVCSEPRNSPLLPAVATRKLLKRSGMSLEQMRLIEINEAFASMPLVTTLDLCDKNKDKAEKLRERVNVNGGAIAIGHPVGATGTRLIMTTLYELRRRKEQYGLACVCGAIGQGDALIVEALY